MKRFTATATTLLLIIGINTYASEHEELLIIDDEDETLILEDSDDNSDLTIEDEQEYLTIEDDTENDEDALILEDSTELAIDEEPDTSETETTDIETVYQQESNLRESGSETEFKFADIWLEYGNFTDSDSAADHQGFLHGKAIYSGTLSQQWEFQLSAQLNGYSESGDESWDELEVDYDESYIRYKSESSIITVGAQKILWGRIDEFPPTDRLSTQDLRRFVIDDLEDRRLASPAIRIEHFIGDSKIDLMILPSFREAELPDKESVWYPVNRHSGEILGLETTPELNMLIQNTPIETDEPSSEGGAGIRYSSLGSGIDYGATLQYGRQSLPYFSYNATKGVIETRYPRSWVVSGDVGIEAFGGTLKLEAAWMSDTAVTKTSGIFDTAESANWGVAWEIFPNDGDGRINLQITGLKLFNAPSVFDRTEIYAFNGAYEVPIADNQWRFKTRFFAGLDDKDFYLNPEIAYTGWDAQEVYLEAHFFDGDNGTIGGFHEDNGLLVLGWRADF